jgi:acyl-coenzyme A thioesterase PaaI-like protein
MSAFSISALSNQLVEGEHNIVRGLWDRVGGLPLGDRAFSRLIGLAAPYTGSMGARVLELREHYCRAQLRDRWSVRNHLTSVHAVALANLAEMTGNLAVAYTLPHDARFIVAGMSTAYLAKARGTITGVCDQTLPMSNEKREYEVVVEMFDAAQQLVARGTLRTLVGPKKRASERP